MTCHLNLLQWPGYPEKGMYIPVQDKDGFLTRNRFASAVGHQILRFVTAMGVSFLSSYP